MIDNDLEIDELDDDRELCPDGACIGVIGPDGRCKECGKKGSGAPRATRPAKPAAAQAARPADADEEVVDEDDADEASADAASDGDEPFDDDRRLCPDGACIGVLGSDGVCKECGARG